MATTANRLYPLVNVSEAPDGPLAIQRLAEAVDVDVEAVDNRVIVLEGKPAVLLVFDAASIAPSWTHLSGGAVHIPVVGGKHVTFSAQQKLVVVSQFNITTGAWTLLAAGAVPAAYRPAVNVDGAGATDGPLGFAPLIMRITTAGELYARASDRDVTVSQNSIITGTVSWRL